MPRHPLQRVEPRLAAVSDRQKWYIVWTDPGTGRSRRRSTGVPREPSCTGNPRRAPVAAVQALDAFIDALDTPQEDMTVGELLDHRLDDLRARLDPRDFKGARYRRTSYRYASIHKGLKAELGSLRADQLTRQRLTRFGQKYHWRRKVSKAFTELRAAYKLAGLTPPDFPKTPARPPRDRFIPREAARKMIAAAPLLHVEVYLTLAFLSGQRRGAILELTWDRVDLDRGIVDFNDPQRALTDKRRAVVHLDRRALGLLRRAREEGRTPYVVEYAGRPVYDIKKGFATAAKAAGVPWATPHHTKHSVISWLAAKGWSIDFIADYTNTNRDTVARVYRKVSPGALEPMSRDLADDLYGDEPVARPVENVESAHAVRGNDEAADG